MVSFSSSTFVQTVSINYEDFNESFLTCGTCLCLYDAGEHSPKLLPCSHTICRQCLEQIVSSNPISVMMLTSTINPSSTTSTPSPSSSASSSASASGGDDIQHHHHHHHHAFRCPICRESIPLPVGGVAALRPNFLVNQLLDLMAQQRREVVPKCSVHSLQELLFCETCDEVFCQDCNGASHSSTPSSDGGSLISVPHTVIPFSIAIKRMSEILLYKAKLCIKKLNEANGIVSAELAELDARASATQAAISVTFDEVLEVVEERRQMLLNELDKMASQKRAILAAQAEEIRMERNLIEAEVDTLHREVEVQTISGKIGELTSKLEMLGSGGLGEPKENSFLCFESGPMRACLASVRDCLAGFGAVRTSTTHPSLSSLLLPDPKQLVTHLECRARVVTVDYQGNPRICGNDPVEAKLVALTEAAGNMEIPVNVVDNEDGTYDLCFVPLSSCQHRLEAKIFNHHLKDSPATFQTSPHVNPEYTFGHRGPAATDDEQAFLQPVAAVYDPHRRLVFILDSGNSRIKILESSSTDKRNFGGQDESLVFRGHLNDCSALEGGSATGLALCPDDSRLAVVNWRTKKITKFDPDDNSDATKTKLEFTSNELSEPTGLAIASDGSVMVLDNGTGKVMQFSPEGKLERVVMHTKTASAIAFGPEDEPVVACLDGKIRVYENTGRIREITAPGQTGKSGNAATKGSFGGLAIDGPNDILLATRSDKLKTCVLVFEYSTGKLKFVIDSPEEKLKRPAGVAILPAGQFLVVDWGNDCVRKYRYR